MVKLFFLRFSFLLIFIGFVLGCPAPKEQEKSYDYKEISHKTYDAKIVARLSVYDETQKLYFASFREVPISYPKTEFFVLRDLRDLRSLYEKIKEYVPSAVKADNLYLRVGNEVVDYDFLANKSAVIMFFEPGDYSIEYSVSAVEKKDGNVYVNVEFKRVLGRKSKNNYILILFDNPIRCDVVFKYFERVN